MAVTQERKNAINELAEKVREKSGASFPVNPVEIAAQYGLTVYKTRMKPDVSGAIFRDGEKFSIYVDQNDSLPRMRFTIAHELGHFFLHMQDETWHMKGDKAGHIDYKLRSPGGESNEETEANTFAAALLMDKRYFWQEWEKYNSIPYLAKEFGVSEEAASIRLNTLKKEQ